MTMAFTVEGDEKLARKLSDRRTKLGPQVAVAADPIEAYTALIGLAAAKHAKDEAPEDQGGIKRGIGFTFRGNKGIVESSAKHTINVIKGRGAGKTQPPLSAILGWVGRHGIPDSAAFPIARAIGERGIKPNDFMKKGFDRMLRQDVAPTKRQFIRQTERNWSR